MIKRFNFEDKAKTAKVFILGLLLGAIITALSLDNRLAALWKAFQNPTVVNGLTISMEIVKK